MESRDVGPKERGWRVAGYRCFSDDDLVWPVVFAPDDGVPIAGIPAFARGECRDVMFGWCMADLREQRAGWLGMVERLSELEVPATTTD